jgi:ABC-2 type transport system permease protein
VTTTAPTAPGTQHAPDLRTFRRPELSLARFVAARTTTWAAVWGAVIGLYVFASASGYDALAPTAAQRQVLLDSLTANSGLRALLGEADAITSVGGFVDWRVLGVMPLLTAIWALITSTKAIRGEEAAGRWELFLAGRTTSRRAVGGALAGFAVAMAVMWLVVAAATAAVATQHQASGLSVGGTLLFASSAVAAPALFLALGALASQLMPTRARAAGFCAGVFGVAFMLRALGDAAPVAHWLVYVSPLGWIEHIHPFVHPQPLWLVPTALLVAVVGGLAVALGERDLGASTFADRDTAEPRTRLLDSSLGLAVRLSRATIAGWLTVTAVAAWLYGTIAHSAGAAFASSSMLRKFGGSLTGDAEHLGSKTYAGVIFFMLMTLIMAYAASSMSTVREQEAQGYLDNLLVRTVSRTRWLAGRLLIAITVVVVAGMLAGAAFWAGAAPQGTGLTLNETFVAGLNACVPGLLLLGIAVAAFGFAPRSTALVAYLILAWSFLLQMLGSAITINHWIMDTSLLNHVGLAPATDPNLRVAWTYLAAAVVLTLLGAWRFTRRDLKTE